MVKDERTSGPGPAPGSDRGEEPGSGAPKPRALYELLKLSTLGLEMGSAVIIGLLIGVWLDGRFGTGPWLTLLFLGFGFAAAAKAVIRALRKGVFDGEDDASAD